MLPLSVQTGNMLMRHLKQMKISGFLISDIMMPEMDGRQLIQTLRGDSGLKDLPIIIMSAVVGIKQISDLLDLGASLFQPKPIDLTELKKTLTVVLRMPE